MPYMRQGEEATMETKERLRTLNQCLADAVDGDGQSRFPAFRQVCELRALQPWDGKEIHPDPCWACGDTGWQVAAGGLEHALAGLTIEQFQKWRQNWIGGLSGLDLHFSEPMPSADEILLAGLKLVCKIAELEVPDAN